jgi:hypothetical protein
MAERKWQTMIYTESKVWETRTLQKKRGLTMTKKTGVNYDKKYEKEKNYKQNNSI